MHYTALLLAFAASVIAAPANVKRDGEWQAHCLHTALDHGDVDNSHSQLYQWAAGNPKIESGDHNEYAPFYSNNVMAYACTDDHYGSNTFSQSDIDGAYAAMDAACPPYTAGYAIWRIQGDWVWYNSGQIIGKDVSTASVCGGYNGN